MTAGTPYNLLSLRHLQFPEERNISEPGPFVCAERRSEVTFVPRWWEYTSECGLGLPNTTLFYVVFYVLNWINNVLIPFEILLQFFD